MEETRMVVLETAEKEDMGEFIEKLQEAFAVAVVENFGIRWGCVPLDSRRGNGPPSRRWIGVLRGRSPTLELRHGPNSYGRQQ